MTLPVYWAGGQMRYIIYLLVVANVLYLGWNLSQGETIVQAKQSLPAIPEGAKNLQATLDAT